MKVTACVSVISRDQTRFLSSFLTVEQHHIFPCEVEKEPTLRTKQGQVVGEGRGWRRNNSTTLVGAAVVCGSYGGKI